MLVRRATIIGLAILGLALAPAAFAQNAHPWEKAQAVLKGVLPEVQSGGIRAVAPHVAEMERVLADIPKLNGDVLKAGDTRFVLADGAGESLILMIIAAHDKSAHLKTVAVPDPYPLIALLLGSYYDEIGRYDDAVRVLDTGLATEPLRSMGQGDTLPGLLSERGGALFAGKHPSKALASYDEGLKITDLSVRMKARMMRGRGGALTDLNRLDEAEAAYKDSLQLEPGNPIALHELQYIASLRQGAAPTNPMLAPLGASKPQ